MLARKKQYSILTALAIFTLSTAGIANTAYGAETNCAACHANTDNAVSLAGTPPAVVLGSKDSKDTDLVALRERLEAVQPQLTALNNHPDNAQNIHTSQLKQVGDELAAIDMEIKNMKASDTPADTIKGLEQRKECMDAQLETLNQ